jgi:parallel beta-helix repeat protein
MRHSSLFESQASLYACPQSRSDRIRVSLGAFMPVKRWVQAAVWVLNLCFLGTVSYIGCSGHNTDGSNTSNPPGNPPIPPTPPTPPPIPPAPPSSYPSPVFRVADYGAHPDTGQDMTQALQTACDMATGTGGTVLIPPGVFMVEAVNQRGIHPGDNSTIHLESGAVLAALPNSSQNYSVVTITTSNVVFEGGEIRGERASHTGSGGEWGMGISVRGGQNVTVRNVLARECWGDGFYIADNASNITIQQVIADHNRRQGMSIIAASNVVVVDSTFSNTEGTLPMAGIDVEPDSGGGSAQNIRVSNCRFTGNAGPGFAFCGSFAPCVDVRLENSLISGNGQGDNESGISVSRATRPVITDCVIEGSTSNGITFYNGSQNGTIANCQIRNNQGRGIEVYQCQGGVIRGCTISGNGGAPVLISESSGWTEE